MKRSSCRCQLPCNRFRALSRPRTMCDQTDITLARTATEDELHAVGCRRRHFAATPYAVMQQVWRITRAAHLCAWTSKQSRSSGEQTRGVAAAALPAGVSVGAATVGFPAVAVGARDVCCICRPVVPAPTNADVLLKGRGGSCCDVNHPASSQQLGNGLAAQRTGHKDSSISQAAVLNQEFSLIRFDSH